MAKRARRTIGTPLRIPRQTGWAPQLLPNFTRQQTSRAIGEIAYIALIPKIWASPKHGPLWTHGDGAGTGGAAG
jgi:hypothetical protein